MAIVHKAVERRESRKHVIDAEIVPQLEPCGKQIFAANKVSEVIAHHAENLGVLFSERGEIFLGSSLRIEVFLLLLRKVLVEDKTEDVVLVFVRLDF